MRDINGYEGIYKISENGEIFSVRTGQPIKLNKKKNGYVYVMLYKKDGGKTHRVHRLVAQAYIKNPYNKPQVNHIDGIKSNNKVSNLEWCNQSENQKHAIKLGLDTVPINNGVYELYKSGEFIGKFYRQLEISKCTGLSLATIGRMIQFKRSSRSGYSIILVERATTRANARTL